MPWAWASCSVSSSSGGEALRALADLLIAVFDLVEAEGRAFRASVARLKTGLALSAVAILLLLAGTGLIIWGLYQALAAPLGPAGGALVTGTIASLLGACLFWAARQAIR